MIVDLLYDYRVRRFLHYAYFPTVAIGSVAFWSWMFQFDTDVDLHKVELNSTLVSEAKIDPMVEIEARKEKERKQRETRKRRQAELNRCQIHNNIAMQRYEGNQTPKNWEDWAAVDRRCRDLKASL